jgi:hypothetical protein
VLISTLYSPPFGRLGPPSGARARAPERPCDTLEVEMAGEAPPPKIIDMLIFEKCSKSCVHGVI